jgi:hypothetical protein
VTSEQSTEPDREPTADGDSETRSQRAASEVAAMVAEQVRDALAVAERSAEDVRRRALDEASGERHAVHSTADQVLARIDELEGRLSRLLRELRGEAMQIRRTVESPSGSEPAVQPPGDSPEAEPSGGERGETWLGPGTGSESEQVHDTGHERPDQPGAEDSTGVEQREEALSWPGRPGDSAASAPEAEGEREPTVGDAAPGSVPAGAPADDVASTAEPASGPTAAPEPRHAGDGESVPAAESVTGDVLDDRAETTGQTTEPEPMAWPAGTEAPAASREGDDEPAPVVRRRRRGLLRHRRDE